MRSSIVRFFCVVLFLAAGAAAVAEPRIWFVDNGRTGGDGSAAAPFDSIGAASAASAAGDVIFVHRGTRPYAEAVVLKERQALVGEGISLASIAAAHGLAASPAASATPGPPPAIEQESGDAVTLAGGTELYGFTVRSAKGRAVVIAGAHGKVAIEQTQIATTGGVALAIAGGDADITLDASPVRAESGTALSVADRTGGSLALRNGSPVTVVAGTRDGISITKSSGSHTFSDALSITTSGQSALRANAAGSIAVNAAASTLKSAGAPALDVTASAVELTFATIDAQDAARGISLDDVTGNLRVNDGTIRNTSSRGVSASGAVTVTLSNMLLQKNATANATAGRDCARTHEEASPRCSAAVHLTGAAATLTHVTIDGSGQLGIFGDRTTALTLSDCEIGGAGDEAGESAIVLRHPRGITSLAKCRIRGSAGRHLSIYTAEVNGTLDIHDSSFTSNKGKHGALDIHDSSFTSNKGKHGEQGVIVEARGKVRYDITIDATTFADLVSHALHVVAAGSANVGVDVSASTFTRTASAIAIMSSDSASLRYRLTGNVITYAASAAIVVNANVSGSSATGTIADNRIGESGKPGSGAPCTCSGVMLTAQRGARFTAQVSGNTIQQVGGSAIQASGRGVSEMQLTISRNKLREPFGAAPLNAIYLEAGVLAADSARVCADVSSNTISGAWDPAGIQAAIMLVTGGPASRLGLAGVPAGRTIDAAAPLLAAKNGNAPTKTLLADPAAKVSPCTSR